ncbi:MULTISPECIES: hypothetical protein [Parachlamydia]|uniref:hypothetical protein n=1 Tax=Parachlamydia TaxID=83551 RepID=UPI0001C174DF|nr:hypothetical protein [Parachlamydia acanthamoebae]EFB41214.1 hypothetical protein pah_c048o034 [Parachlamydia acanthamoebae str. Hall's coccus]
MTSPLTGPIARTIGQSATNSPPTETPSVKHEGRIWKRIFGGIGNFFKKFVPNFGKKESTVSNKQLSQRNISQLSSPAAKKTNQIETKKTKPKEDESKKTEISKKDNSIKPDTLKSDKPTLASNSTNEVKDTALKTEVPPESTSRATAAKIELASKKVMNTPVSSSSSENEVHVDSAGEEHKQLIPFSKPLKELKETEQRHFKGISIQSEILSAMVKDKKFMKGLNKADKKMLTEWQKTYQEKYIPLAKKLSEKIEEIIDPALKPPLTLEKSETAVKEFADLVNDNGSIFNQNVKLQTSLVYNAFPMQDFIGRNKAKIEDFLDHSMPNKQFKDTYDFEPTANPLQRIPRYGILVDAIKGSLKLPNQDKLRKAVDSINIKPKIQDVNEARKELDFPAEFNKYLAIKKAIRPDKVKLKQVREYFISFVIKLDSTKITFPISIGGKDRTNDIKEMIKADFSEKLGQLQSLLNSDESVQKKSGSTISTLDKKLNFYLENYSELISDKEKKAKASLDKKEQK